VNVYRPYYYHGVSYSYYMPVHYYRPAYYGWVGSLGAVPSSTVGAGRITLVRLLCPISRPNPSIAALFWLTDFFIAATLQSAMNSAGRQRRGDEQQADYQAQEARRPRSADVADEAQRQLAQERAIAKRRRRHADAPRDTFRASSTMAPATLSSSTTRCRSTTEHWAAC